MRPRAAAAAATAILLAAAAVTKAKADVIEEVAATVNGQIITRTELLTRESQVRAQISRQFTGDDQDQKITEARRNILTDLVREVALLQRAEILGLDLDKVYKSALDNLKDQQGIKTNDELNALMKQEGVTEDELRQILLRYNVPDIMINLEVRQKIAITEDEERAYFEKHRDEYRVEESYKLREVVILSEGHSEADLEEVAGKVKAEMAAGTPFPELVLKYSEAPSRFQEGIVGPFNAADLTPDLREAVSKLKVDEVAGPIRLKGNVHFVQLVAKTEAAEPDFDRVRTGVENKMKQERFQKDLDAYWERLFKENRIVIKDRYKIYAVDIPKS